MSALRSLHSDASGRIIAAAFVASLLLHAVLIAWPRWPAWHDAVGGLDAMDGPIRAQLVPATSRVDGTVAEARATEAAASHHPLDSASAVAPLAPASPPTTAGDAAQTEASRGVPPRRVVEPLETGDRPAARASSRDRRSTRRGESPESPASNTMVVSASRPGEVDSATAARVEAQLTATEDRPMATATSQTTMAAPAVRAERGERSDIASIAQYRIALISASRRFKPPVGVISAEGSEGRVDVQLSIAADGSLAGARVLRSSGHHVLDDIAIDMLRNAKTQAPVPPVLLQRAFDVDVPVVFGRAAAEKPPQ